MNHSASKFDLSSPKKEKHLVSWLPIDSVTGHQPRINVYNVIKGNLSVGSTTSTESTISFNVQHPGVVIEPELGSLGEAAADAEEGEGQHEADVHAARGELEGFHWLRGRPVVVGVGVGVGVGVCLVVLRLTIIHLLVAIKYYTFRSYHLKCQITNKRDYYPFSTTQLIAFYNISSRSFINSNMQYLLGIPIDPLENGLLYLALFFLSLYFIAIAIQKKPHWFLSNNLRECLKIEQKFEKLLASRRDVLHHYYWARSENQTKKMKDMDKDLVRLDEEIEQMRSEYRRKRNSLTKIVQKLM